MNPAHRVARRFLDATAEPWVLAWAAKVAGMGAATHALQQLVQNNGWVWAEDSTEKITRAYEKVEAVAQRLVGAKHLPTPTGRGFDPDDLKSVLHALGAAGYNVRERARNLDPKDSRIAWIAGDTAMEEKSNLLRHPMRP
jgi:hypothetical protein